MKYILICFFMVSCSPGQSIEEVMVYSCEDVRQDLAKFIVDCSKAANPLSDEEGEDLVAQCEKTGRRTLCPTKQMCVAKSVDGVGYVYRVSEPFECLEEPTNDQ